MMPQEKTINATTKKNPDTGGVFSLEPESSWAGQIWGGRVKRLANNTAACCHTCANSKRSLTACCDVNGKTWKMALQPVTALCARLSELRETRPYIGRMSLHTQLFYGADTGNPRNNPGAGSFGFLPFFQLIWDTLLPFDLYAMLRKINFWCFSNVSMKKIKALLRHKKI